MMLPLTLKNANKNPLKYYGKLVFSNSSTHLCSKATQGMYRITKEKLSKRKHV